jgi:hypothetical protein
MLVAIPIGFMIINELLLSLSIQWQHIKDLVTLTVSRVEGLFHFENINFEGRVDYRHRYHPIERDVHHGLALGKHFILLQNCYNFILFIWISSIVLSKDTLSIVSTTLET